MNANQARKPQQRCAACFSINSIRLLEMVDTSDGPTELALCLDFIACNRRWGRRAVR